MPTQENGYDAGTAPEGNGFPDAGVLQERLNSLLSDPESMGRLFQMASGLASSGLFSGMSGGNAPSGTGNEGETASEAVGAPSEEPSVGNPSAGNPSVGKSSDAAADREERRTPAVSHGMRGKHSGGKHAALLKALRPYMSAPRQSRIDQMLQLLQLAEAAETILQTQNAFPGAGERAR